MRTGALMVSILVPVLALACDPEPEPFDESLKDAISMEVEETLAGLTEAMNSHDPNRVFEYFKNGEEFLYLGCTDVLLGFDAFSQRVGPFYEANPDVTFQQEVVQIQVLSPTVAVAALRGASSEIEGLFWTEVLLKEDGAWLIAHEHESWPGCSPPSAPHPFTSPSEVSGIDPANLSGD